MQIGSFLNNLCAAHWTNYLIDVVLIVVLLLFVFVCAKRGFVECFFGLISTTAAIITAVLFSKLLLSITGGLFGLQGWFDKLFTGAFSKINGFDMLISSEGMDAALANKDLSAILVNLAVKWFGKGNFPADTTVAMVLGGVSARLVCMLIIGVLIFLIVKLLFLLLRKGLGAVIKRISLLRGIDAFLGMLVGLTEGILLISGIISILTLIPSDTLAAYLNNSAVVGLLYNHNPIIWLIGLFI
ncbi:MAG: CvpA family protein [Clostridia bacterium]|nr:CvpA family protein [Clostridia bacterium]